VDLGSIIADDSVTTEAGVRIDQVRQTRDSEDSSGSTSEEEDSPLTDESDEDEDSYSDIDSEGEEATRKTALGAGVELLSRHKDHQEPRFSSIATTSVIKDSSSSTV